MGRFVVLAAIALWAASPALAISILTVERVELVDDGDRDGILDTGESLRIFLTLSNTSSGVLPPMRNFTPIGKSSGSRNTFRLASKISMNRLLSPRYCSASA